MAPELHMVYNEVFEDSQEAMNYFIVGVEPPNEIPNGSGWDNEWIEIVKVLRDSNYE